MKRGTKEKTEILSSFRMSGDLYTKIKEYAKETDRNFSSAWRYLVKRGLEAEAVDRRDSDFMESGK
jgi:predicted DNA-binding ribbon-helix-helix protein